jgi:phospholipase/lecithinase/hemolysin
LPDLSSIPLARKYHVTDRLHNLTIAHNQKLDAAVSNFKKSHSNTDVVYVNVYDIFQQVISNPTQFNQQYGQHISNYTDACWQGGSFIQNSVLKKDIESELKLTHKQDANFSAKEVAASIAGSPSLAQAYQTGKLFNASVKPCEDAASYVFWDNIHPTAAMHHVLGNIVIKSLEDSRIMS